MVKSEVKSLNFEIARVISFDTYTGKDCKGNILVDLKKKKIMKI